MQIITGIESHRWTKKTAVTLGKFDGLHRGHQKLVNRIMEYKSPECDSVLCAFDMGRVLTAFFAVPFMHLTLW